LPDSVFVVKSLPSQTRSHPIGRSPG
jgi:hypothetical protein